MLCVLVALDDHLRFVTPVSKTLFVRLVLCMTQQHPPVHRGPRNFAADHVAARPFVIWLLLFARTHLREEALAGRCVLLLAVDVQFHLVLRQLASGLLIEETHVGLKHRLSVFVFEEPAR